MTSTVGEKLRDLAQGARSYYKRTWWVFLIGGIVSVVFGVLAFMEPGTALAVLSMYFAVFVLISGAVHAWGALTHRDTDGWWVSLLMGIVALAVGVFALANPPLTMVAFLYMVAFMAIATGIGMIMLGWQVRDASDKEWLLYVIGALSLLLGGLMLFRPAVGAQSAITLIATWAVLIGALKIFLALKARHAVGNVEDRIREKVASD